MSYGTLATRWTVTHIDSEDSTKFDLQKDDVLELTGDGEGGNGIMKRHRNGSTTDWGRKCTYVATPAPKVTGEHIASEEEDKFEFLLPVMHAGRISRKEGGGTGGHGTWIAEEGG